jgi:hypothetical protein
MSGGYLDGHTVITVRRCAQDIRKARQRRADQQLGLVQPVRCCRMRSFIARAALDNAAPAGLRLAAALAGRSPSGVAQVEVGQATCTGAGSGVAQPLPPLHGPAT